MKKTAILVLLVFALVAAWPGHAQAPPPQPPPGAPQPPPPPQVVVAKFLEFSETQATQFNSLLDTLHETMLNIQQQVQGKEKQMEDLLKGTVPDPAAVGRLFLEIRTLHQQGGKANDAYHEAFLGLLSDQQKEKVQQVVRARELTPIVGAFTATQLLPPLPPQPPGPPPPPK